MAELGNAERSVCRAMCDVAISLGLDSRLVDCARPAEEIYDLIAGPSFRVDPCIDDESYRAEEFGGEAPVIRDWILVEADLFAEFLGIQGPAFDVGIEAETMEAKLGQTGELLLH